MTTARSDTPEPNGAMDGPEPLALVELLFFAYRDFVGEPDRILSRYSFGRAHHRVLHFVCRYPGQTVAELLDILSITKQSLARVLRDLVSGGFIEQRAGDHDRRQRLLFATGKGAALARELMTMQSRRMVQALARIEPSQRAAVQTFLLGLMDGEGRTLTERMSNGAAKGAG